MEVFVKLFNQVRLAVKLMMDARIPIYLKALPVLSLAYVIMPIDIIPDMIPVLGQLDDIGVLILGIETFIRLSPQSVVDEHRAMIEGGNVHSSKSGTATGSPPAGGNVVDGEWKEVKR